MQVNLLAVQVETSLPRLLDLDLERDILRCLARASSMSLERDLVLVRPLRGEGDLEYLSYHTNKEYINNAICISREKTI